jgi:FeS assembly SUF system regulator
MLRLTKLADYGILLMTHMAASEEKLHTAGDLSAVTHVPQPTVSKILQMLLNDQLLVSIRGARGGYRLARPAKEISIVNVISTLEGHIALTECNLDDCDCAQQPVCGISGSWQRINEAVHMALQGITLADMVQSDFMPVMRMERAVPLKAVEEMEVRT